MSSIFVKQDIMPSSTQLDNLFQAIGWRPRGAQKWEQVLSKSSCVTSVWKNEQLIGFARLLEDGVMCMVYDVGVLPAYQRQGIGSAMMEQLLNYVRTRTYASIGLWPWHENPANLPFYAQFGFVVESGGMELKKYMCPE